MDMDSRVLSSVFNYSLDSLNDYGEKFVAVPALTSSYKASEKPYVHLLLQKLRTDNTNLVLTALPSAVYDIQNTQRSEDTKLGSRYRTHRIGGDGRESCT